MINNRDLQELCFENMFEYFDNISELYSNGDIREAKKHVSLMSDLQKQACVNHLDTSSFYDAVDSGECGAMDSFLITVGLVNEFQVSK